ncbi:MAG: hypothetical protein HY822_22450 [Acidobacteria bacterium]|nr:hypothetical protein [Acidobacteriota bacterium]
MITVRLSEEEYEQLQSLCTNVGARNTSDATRMALESLAYERTGDRDELVDQKLRQLERRIIVLTGKVEEICRTLPPRPNGPQERSCS